MGSWRVLGALVTASVLVVACSNDCKKDAKLYTDLAATCGAETVTYDFKGTCDEEEATCINACDFLSDTQCDTDKTTQCFNDCLARVGTGGGAVGGGSSGGGG